MPSIKNRSKNSGIAPDSQLKPGDLPVKAVENWQYIKDFKGNEYCRYNVSIVNKKVYKNKSNQSQMVIPTRVVLNIEAIGKYGDQENTVLDIKYELIGKGNKDNRACAQGKDVKIKFPSTNDDEKRKNCFVNIVTATEYTFLFKVMPDNNDASAYGVNWKVGEVRFKFERKGKGELELTDVWSNNLGIPTQGEGAKEEKSRRV